MKQIIFLLLAFLALPSLAANPDTVKVYPTTVPIMLGEGVNPVIDLSIENTSRQATLDAVEIEFDNSQNIKYIASVDIFYTGTTSMFLSRTTAQALRIHAGRVSGGQTIFRNPAYAIAAGGSTAITQKFKINSSQKLFCGANYIYISLKLKAGTPLTATFDPRVKSVTISGQNMPLEVKNEYLPLRVGVSVRNAGQDGVDSYRIPGLATAKDGSLLAVYDIRNTSSTDLQEDIQIGLSRSTDGGRTWLPMQTIIDMRNYGVLPASQNGVGDPAILVDQNTGRVWVIALWNHGIGANTGWFNLRQGLTPEQQAAQVVTAYSDNNGKTWSKAINITSQVKLPEWFITLQGPGRGITMRDGTLVFAFQYVDTDRLPYSTIIYSKDHGQTWHTGKGIKSNTTEAQVVETADGELMINARDNRGGSRTVMTTRDLGQTWVEHSSSRGALREPVCMASLYKATYEGRTILFFSNPNTTKGRHHMTIKASVDMGQTWSSGVLLDAEPGWGYSCLTSVDESALGILYEGSRSQMTFEAISIADLLK
ncbi:MAG: sialidase family protein [Mucinivorans sp.]